jgi:DNA-binding transcriptional ArsR family regulator
MQPRYGHDMQPPGDRADRALPMQLAQALEPKARRALTHVVRRRILRAFSEDPTPRTPEDLQMAFPGDRLATINYHLLVLGDCGSVTVSRVEQARGTAVRSFVSNVTGDAQYVAVLRATERLDDEAKDGLGHSR